MRRFSCRTGSTWDYCWWPWGGTLWSWRCCGWLGPPAPASWLRRWPPGSCHSAPPSSPGSARRTLAAGGSLRKQANVMCTRRRQRCKHATSHTAGLWTHLRRSGPLGCIYERRVLTVTFCWTLIVRFSKWICASVRRNRNTRTHTKINKWRKQLRPCSESLWNVQLPGTCTISTVRPTFRKSVTATYMLFLPVPHKHVLPRKKHPAAIVRSPPSGSVLVLKLGGWQHDVKLNGCPRSYQVLCFQRRPCLGPSAGCVYTSWLCSVRVRWMIKGLAGSYKRASTALKLR